MKPSVVRIVDMGFDANFHRSASFVQATISSLTAAHGYQRDPAEIEFVRSRDDWILAMALDQPADVIHILAHGVSDADGVCFTSEDEMTVLYVGELAQHFWDHESGIEAKVLFADCCVTAQKKFQRAMSDCLEEPTLYIGASRNINWWEGTTYASAFYAAYFRRRGKGTDRVTHAERAAHSAIRAYEELVQGPCPYRVQILEPSAKARRAFGLA